MGDRFETRLLCLAFLFALLAGCEAPVRGVPRHTATSVWIKTNTEENAPRVHSWSSGEGEIPLVVAAGSLLGPDLKGLTAGRYTVFYDGRGEGSSDSLREGDELGLEADVQDIEALRRELGAERISLLGWSYWGGVAARYAQAYPQHVESLVLIAPLPISRDPHYALFIERAQAHFDVKRLAGLQKKIQTGEAARDPRGFAREYTQFYLESYVVDQDCLKAMRGVPNAEPNSDPLSAAKRSEQKMRKLADWDWHADFSELPVPTLVIAGTEDVIPTESSKDWADTIPGAELLLLENCGHLPWLETPERFNPAVQGFLDSER